MSDKRNDGIRTRRLSIGKEPKAEAVKSRISSDTPWLRYKPGTYEKLPLNMIDATDTRFKLKEDETTEHKELVNRLSDSLKKDGQVNAVKVVFRPPRSKVIIVDGWTTFSQLRGQGAPVIDCKILDHDLSDQELLELRCKINELRRTYTLRERFQCVKNLAEKGQRYSCRELSEKFGMPSSAAEVVNRAIMDARTAQRVLKGEGIRQILSHASESSRSSNKSPLQERMRFVNFNPKKGTLKIVIEARGHDDLKTLRKDISRFAGEVMDEVEKAMAKA